MSGARRTLPLASLFLLAGLLAPPAPASAQVGPGATGDTSVFRPLDLPAPDAYRDASGSPGPMYWQQEADYRIRATLDTASKALSGSETVTYENHSPDTLRYVWMQVDQNIYEPGSEGSFLYPPQTRFGGRSFQGGYTITDVSVGGSKVEPYIHDTMMRLDLPAPLAPGASTSIRLSFSFPVPRHGSDRMGRRGSLYEMAEWYPRMAVYDDVNGWNTDPYMGQGEFYLEYGDFDVSLTVPADYVLGATGRLRNAGDVLTSAERDRLRRAASSDSAVAVIGPDEVGTASTRPGSGDGALTWHFTAHRVHDFAWAGAPDFLWDARSTRIGDHRVTCHALYEPDASRAWRTGADMTCFSIHEFSRWRPYPWPQATSVAGPVLGMEYPMIVFVESNAEERALYGVLTHEQGHEWYPMTVGSNERRFAWMDEGFNTFIDGFSNQDRYPDETPWATYTARYDTAVADGRDVPVMTVPDRIPARSLGVAAYRKPAMVLHLLRDEVLGPETFDEAFRTYTRRWAFRHPRPADFFRTMEDVSGRDLDWFFREWLYTTRTLDQRVVGVRESKAGDGWVARIELATSPGMVMPVDLRLYEDGGKTQDVHLPVMIWYHGPDYTYTARLPSRLVGAEVDPEHAMPDQDRMNDAWGRTGGS
ncbi:MAG TPA: M1 family metallopeptidase [Gemmatimonadota bacterium]|nr:M1 family metallopeptidase [Gemmatimonadota bacterium]